MRTCFVLTGFLCLAGCGYVGDPLYPAVNIPARIQDLGVVERGANLAVTFTIPALTTEGLALKKPGGVELRVGANKSSQFTTEAWAENATRVEIPAPEKPGPMSASVPVARFAGQDVIVGVRVSNLKGRYSAWSNLVTIKVEQPLTTPAALRATGVPNGVHVTWEAPGESSFRIFRRADSDATPSLLGVSDRPEYLDETTVYGKRFEYWVEAVRGAQESELAGPQGITTKDTFAPAVPAGLTATAGLHAIELAWERNTESDFRGYRVYRANGDGSFEIVADLVEAPNYSDQKIEAGKRYRYRVSALDQAGNESEKSAVVEATAP